MVYALIITTVAALVLLAIPTVLVLAGRRATEGNFSISGWSWRPNALGLTLLAIVAVVLLGRFFPVVFFLPMLIPFFWRFRGGRKPGTGGPLNWQWRARRGPPPSTNGHSNGHKKDGQNTIEGQYRNVDDE